MILAAAPSISVTYLAVTSGVLFIFATAAVALGLRPAMNLVARQEHQFDEVLRGKLLLDVTPRTATVLAAAGMIVAGAIGYFFSGNSLGAVIGLGVGMLFPPLTLRYLKNRRLTKLEDHGAQCAGVLRDEVPLRIPVVVDHPRRA